MSRVDAARPSARDLLESRWVLRIIEALGSGPHRFADLRRRVFPISAPILSQKLILLEQASIVRRRVLDPNLRVVVYELTAWGQACRPVLDAIDAWERSELRD